MIAERTCCALVCGGGGDDGWQDGARYLWSDAPCFALQEVDAHTVREVCSKYFYDQCPAVAGLGEWAGSSTPCASPGHCLGLPFRPGIPPPCPAPASLEKQVGAPQEARASSLAARDFLLRGPVPAAPCLPAKVPPSVPHTPPGNGHLCRVGPQGPEHEGTGSAPRGMFSSLAALKACLVLPGQQFGAGCGTGPGVPVQPRHPTLTPRPIPTGPIEQLSDYNRIRSGMFWLRF